MQNLVKKNEVAVVSTAVGYTPVSYAPKPFAPPIPSSAFKPAAEGLAVVLSNPVGYKSGSKLGLAVTAVDPATGAGGQMKALAFGFPGGEGSPAASAFKAAVLEAVASGQPVFLAVAGNSSEFFCALSDKPFGVLPVVDGASGEDIAF